MFGWVGSQAAKIALAVIAMAAAGDDLRYSSISAIRSRPRAQGSEGIVQGALTFVGNPSYIQDATGGAEVEGLSTQGLKIGDELLISGLIEDSETGLTFRHSKVDFLWHGSPVPPISVTAEDASLGKFAALLVEVNGRFVRTQERNGKIWLRLESGHQVFMARLGTAGGASLLPSIEEGSTLRLRGVCSLKPQDTQYQGGFALLLRSAEDVTVISGPPWWSFKHLIELGIFLGVLVIAGHLSLVQLLKARFRAIMAERARLGHELHDTLAQSFAGLSFQIQAARKTVTPTNELLAKHLDVALDMVRHSHAEAHRSIMMLRPQQLAEGADLPAAIHAALDQSTVGCRLKTRFTIEGAVERLPLMVTDTLYRVAQEAMANALRHGQPTSLQLKLEYRPDCVRLSVVDDGVGFEVKTSHNRGFGLAGMHERVRALRGDFSVRSELGKGTCVVAEIHLRQKPGRYFVSAMNSRITAYWGRLQNLFRLHKSDNRNRLTRV